MSKYFLCIGLLVVLFGCNSSSKPVPNVDFRDTVIVAYNSNGYMFNKAIAWTHTQRKFLKDSGLDAGIEVVTQFALRLPATKADSIMDSTTHKLLRINEHYQPVFLSDTLSHYIHILDTIHTH